MGWAGINPKQIFPLSRERRSLARALLEWHYTGEHHLSFAEDATCVLCGAPLRYVFGLINEHTSRTLSVGAECALAVVSRSEARDPSEREALTADRKKLATRSRQLELRRALRGLEAVDPQFSAESFIRHMDRVGAFTPRQLDALLWRLESHDVSYDPSALRVRIRRDREKEQLLEMPAWRARRLWPCLSTQQRRWYIERKGFDPSQRRRGPPTAPTGQHGMSNPPGCKKETRHV